MAALMAAADTAAADWIVAALRTFGGSVTGLVPDSFPAYVRVFHPAYLFDRASPQPWETRTTVRWSEIAEANGTRVHAGMQLCSMTGSYRFQHREQPGVYDHAPSDGSLPIEVALPLIDILTLHTEVSETCWFAVWKGFGATRMDVRLAPTFRVPAREYHLLTGPISAVAQSVLDPPWIQSPNIWWPDDRAWCVATEIDLNTTYIGCSHACRDEILNASSLEALDISPAAEIAWASDDINPPPTQD